MKLRDLVAKIFDEVIIFNRVGKDYVNIHHGSSESIPCSILDMDSKEDFEQFKKELLG